MLSDCSAGNPSCPIFALLLREVMLSYRVLFGQRRDSRKEFQKFQRKRVTDIATEYDPLLDIICGDALGTHVDALPAEIWPEAVVDESGRLLEQDVYSTSLEFPLLGARLLKIQEFDVRQQPSRVRDLWRDRRNPLQWYAFWAVLIIGGITIGIAVLQLVVASLALAYQIQQTNAGH